MIVNVTSEISRIAKLITAANTDVVVKDGSVVNSAFILPAASVSAWSSNLATFVEDIQSLDLLLALQSDTTTLTAVAEALNLTAAQVQALASSCIDRVAANYGESRKAATAAEGLVRFYTYTLPTSNITISAGTEVQTSSGVVFYVVNSVTLIASQAATYYDASLGAYAITALVRAQETGAQTSVAAEAITVFTSGSAPSGVDEVINPTEFDTGYDSETDAKLIARIKTKLAGQSLQTAAGLAAVVTGNTPLRTILVADAQSPYQLRNDGYGGVADVYTKDSIPTLASETLNYPGSPILSNQPVLGLISITSGSTVYTEGTDYEFIEDLNVLYRGSSIATSHIRWLIAPPAEYQVTYVYNYAVTVAQTAIDNDAGTPLMGDPENAVLARQGVAKKVKIGYKVVLTSSSTSSATTIIANAVAAVQAVVDALGFGDSLTQDDVIAALSSVSGISRVYTTPVYFCVYNEGTGTYGVNEDPITANGYEYIQAREIIISQ